MNWERIELHYSKLHCNNTGHMNWEKGLNYITLNYILIIEVIYELGNIISKRKKVQTCRNINRRHRSASYI